MPARRNRHQDRRHPLGLSLGAVAATIVLLPASAEAGLVDPHPVTPQIVTPQVSAAPAATPTPSSVAAPPSATVAPGPASVPASTSFPRTPAPTYSPSPTRQSVNADVARRQPPEQLVLVRPPAQDAQNRLRAAEAFDWEEEQMILDTVHRLVSFFAGTGERQVTVPETIANDIGVDTAARLIGANPDDLVVIPGSQPVGPYQQAEIDAQKGAAGSQPAPPGDGDGDADSAGSVPLEIDDPGQSEQ